MKVAVVGSGARESAILWKALQSPYVDSAVAAPGTIGTKRMAAEFGKEARNLDARIDTLDGIAGLKRSLRAMGFTDQDLIVCGPELPLALNIKDVFEPHIAVFGPDAYAARLETSKADAKRSMRRWGVPTADFEVFGLGEPDGRLTADDACAFIDRTWPKYSIVKVDGLAEGKGVFVHD
ncbi:MAG: hypothetical protein KGH72_03585 [Candidatus Micrarchaeota archaeon]|nr:hypothetical protein [Candidatus Micrarchaeota archaeon]